MTNPRFSAPLVGVLALAAAASTHAAVNEWTETGPDAGWSHQVAIHPTNSQIALLSTVRGIYRTTDGTAHWTLVNGAATGSDLAFDPSNPNIVVHASEKVWMSVNGGQSFALGQSPAVDYIRQVEISAAGTIYVAGQNKVFKSTDHGNTWTSCGAPWPQGAWLGALVVDPNANAGGDHLFLRASDLSVSPISSATWRSVNGCASWIQAGAGDPAVSPNSVSHFAVMPGNPDRVLAAAYDGIYRSTNGGDTWSKVQIGTTDWIAFDKTAGSVSALSAFGRLMHSTDGGDTWDPFHGADVQVPAGATFTYDPQVAGRLILASPNGPYVSTDGGLYYTLRATGLRAAYLGDFSTADDGSVYAVFHPGAGGVFRRDPSTLTWAPLDNDELKQKASTNGFTMSAVATAPGNASRIYASAWPSNLSLSTDGGSSWGAKHPFFPVTSPVKQILDLAVDPDDELIAFAATENGLAKTTDGGTTWAASNSGLPSYSKFVLPLRDSNVVYAIAQDPNVAYSNAVYKSTNNGDTWSPTGAMPALVAAGQLLSIAVDPQDSNVVYAGHNGGVYKSTNGGTSWTAMAFSGQAAPYATGMSVLVDPDYSTTLTLASSIANSGVVRTTDGGVHWEHILVPRGVSPNAPALERAVLDPLRPNVLIAGVYPATISEYEVGTDLELVVSGIESPLATSTSRVVTFTVKNLGPHAASPSELTLLLPAWLTPADPGDCGVAVQTVRCRIPPLWINDSHTFSMPLAVSAAGGTGPFSVVLNTHETDTDMFSNSFSRQITGSEQANLSLGYAVSRNNIEPGESMTLTFGLANNGPSISTLTTLDLPIPAGIEVTGYTAATQGTCAVTAGTFHCDLGTVPVGISRIVNVDLLAVTPGTRDLVAHADGAGADTGLAHTNHFVLRVLPVSDLSVSLAESADPVTIGEDFSYTVTVKNLSGDAADAVVPVSVTGTTIFRLVSSSGMSCPTAVPTQVMNCEISSLPAGATATAVIGATAILPGIATASATATHSGRDTNPDNNTATIGTTLREVANLSVEVSDSVDPASVSVPFQYTVTVRNSGPNNPAVSITIPVTGASISNAVASYGSCTHNGSTANCTIPQLDNGGSQVITITASSAVPGTASATATASLAGFDPDTANNSATAETAVRAVADIGVAIVDSADPVTAGGVLSYLVTLTTAGPSSGNVRLTVPVTGSTVTGATPSQGGTCTVAAGSVTCDFAPMDFSPSTVNIVINSATAGTVTATATATFSGTDPVAANNSATATTTVNAPPSSGSSSGGGGGGGGGGRFDWLALGLLGLLLASRGWLRVPARRGCRPRPRCPP
jgi:hypothetical protein